MLKSKGNIKKGTFISLVLISIFILIPQGVMANLVVCFEEDGHINIETAHYGECCSYIKTSLPEFHSHPYFLRNFLGKNQCHPCKDVAFTNNDSKQNILSVEIKLKLIKTFMFVALANQLPQDTEIRFNELLVLSLPANNSVLASMSSIVLLI